MHVQRRAACYRFRFFGVTLSCPLHFLAELVVGVQTCARRDLACNLDLILQRTVRHSFKRGSISNLDYIRAWVANSSCGDLLCAPLEHFPISDWLTSQCIARRLSLLEYFARLAETVSEQAADEVGICMLHSRSHLNFKREIVEIFQPSSELPRQFRQIRHAFQAVMVCSHLKFLAC